jgi:hypothetical protein
MPLHLGRPAGRRADAPSRTGFALGVATALLSVGLGCGPTAGGAAHVACRDLDSGYTTRYTGDAALVACVRDPRMQMEGHRREARLSAGRFDFGDGARLELGSGWTIAGAGPDATTIHASRPTTHVFQDDLHSLFLVRGSRVQLRGFAFDGSCAAGPSPAPECRALGDQTLLAIVVACGYGLERPPDCDVDGLMLEDLRVLHVKTPFLATSSDPDPASGQKGIFANFRDFSWTIRRFQVASRADGFRYARVFELGNSTTAEMSQGPGVGVSSPRRYRVRFEDLAIDTPVGQKGGQLAGILTATVNAPVSLEIEVVRSRLVATQRLIGIATHTVDRPGADRGQARLLCEDSTLVADPRDWEERLRTGGAACPPFEAAVRLGENERVGGNHHVRADLRRCDVRAEPFLALCPAPASIDLGRAALASHVSLCSKDATLTPPPRGGAPQPASVCAREWSAPGS